VNFAVRFRRAELGLSPGDSRHPSFCHGPRMHSFAARSFGAKPRPLVISNTQKASAGRSAEGGTGSPQGLLPGAPTDPGVRVKDAPGSSRCGIAVPHTTRSFRGDTLMRHGVLSVVPTPRPQRGTPFAPRGPEGRSPVSTLLWGTVTPCRPFRRASFPSLGDTTLVPLVRPQRPRTRDRGSTWSWLPVAPSGQCRGNGKVSQVPGEPF
jgi:hypothetical protein